ncbi:MAG: galactokinase, partial [Oscillospiraceae bacterium]|nr:galactokinase [Oscillospiraceae bacterium]
MEKTDLKLLYGDNADAARDRYRYIEKRFAGSFGGDAMFFSAPGRTEVGGNHTDHNRGRVLAAAVGLDVAAAVRPDDSGLIRIKSEGFSDDTVDISDLTVHEEEKNTSAALIRGVCAGFVRAGHKITGFSAYAVSDVLKGSGLSSSAAFEVLIGTILSHTANGGSVSAVEIAQIAQYAENVYFGKPSGLMDQMASSVGGFITIDFKDTASPVIESIPFDIKGYDLFIVDTKGNHADLTPEYAAIPAEMKSIAAHFGKKELRDITKADITEDIAALRRECGDRAVARAYHFFDENERVIKEADALRNGDTARFLALVNESGDSSYKYLQNIFAVSDTVNEGLVMGLYTAKDVLCGRGASRVHGGGFAGTIQA